MSKSFIFKNTGLYEIKFLNEGRDIALYFTDTSLGHEYGHILCLGIKSLIFHFNDFVDYSDDTDTLFPLFIPEIAMTNHENHSEIIIDIGIYLKISACKIIVKKVTTH